MKASCPVCGARFDLDAAVSDADGRRLMALLAEVPASLGPTLLQYIGLFRPAKSGLRYTRMLTLIEELLPSIQAQQVTRGGRHWPAPISLWKESMLTLAGRPEWVRYPLKGHGLLLKLVGDAGDKLAASTERRQEDQLRKRPHVGQTLSAAELAERKMREQWDTELGLNQKQSQQQEAAS